MAGFRTTSDGRCIEEETSFLMVMRGSQIIDVSLTPGDKSGGFLTAIVGIENGLQVDFDRKTGTIFWIEGKEDDEENVSFCFGRLNSPSFDLTSFKTKPIFIFSVQFGQDRIMAVTKRNSSVQIRVSSDRHLQWHSIG